MAFTPQSSPTKVSAAISCRTYCLLRLLNSSHGVLGISNISSLFVKSYSFEYHITIPHFVTNNLTFLSVIYDLYSLIVIV